MTNLSITLRQIVKNATGINTTDNHTNDWQFLNALDKEITQVIDNINNKLTECDLKKAIEYDAWLIERFGMLKVSIPVYLPNVTFMSKAIRNNKLWMFKQLLEYDYNIVDIDIYGIVIYDIVKQIARSITCSEPIKFLEYIISLKRYDLNEIFDIVHGQIWEDGLKYMIENCKNLEIERTLLTRSQYWCNNIIEKCNNGSISRLADACLTIPVDKFRFDYAIEAVRLVYAMSPHNIWMLKIQPGMHASDDKNGYKSFVLNSLSMVRLNKNNNQKHKNGAFRTIMRSINIARLDIKIWEIEKASGLNIRDNLNNYGSHVDSILIWKIDWTRPLSEKFAIEILKCGHSYYDEIFENVLKNISTDMFCSIILEHKKWTKINWRFDLSEAIVSSHALYRDHINKVADDTDKFIYHLPNILKLIPSYMDIVDICRQKNIDVNYADGAIINDIYNDREKGYKEIRHAYCAFITMGANLSRDNYRVVRLAVSRLGTIRHETTLEIEIIERGAKKDKTLYNFLLWVAAYQGSVELVNKYLSLGADPTYEDSKVLTCTCKGAEQNKDHNKVFNILYKLCKSFNNNMVKNAVKYNFREAIYILVRDKDCDFRMEDNICIKNAVFWWSSKMIPILIELSYEIPGQQYTLEWIKENCTDRVYKQAKNYYNSLDGCFTKKAIN